jgi:hypothetical protein
MGAQRKKYLQLANAAAAPRSKLFYKLMADLAPAVNDMARAQVNQVGASIIYDVVLRASAAILTETAFNLGRGEIDQDRLLADFKLVVDQSIASQQVLRAVPVTPKLDS